MRTWKQGCEDAIPDDAAIDDSVELLNRARPGSFQIKAWICLGVGAWAPSSLAVVVKCVQAPLWARRLLLSASYLLAMLFLMMKGLQTWPASREYPS